MSLGRPMPYEEIPFDHARNKKSHVSPKRVGRDDLESSDLKINFGI
jgi:hypothetical protein